MLAQLRKSHAIISHLIGFSYTTLLTIRLEILTLSPVYHLNVQPTTLQCTPMEEHEVRVRRRLNNNTTPGGNQPTHPLPHYPFRDSR